MKTKICEFMSSCQFLINQGEPNSTGPNIEKPRPTAPVTPDACDTKLVLDAVTLVRGEMLFFKDGYVL